MWPGDLTLSDLGMNFNMCKILDKSGQGAAVFFKICEIPQEGEWCSCSNTSSPPRSHPVLVSVVCTCFYF